MYHYDSNTLYGRSDGREIEDKNFNQSKHTWCMYTATKIPRALPRYVANLADLPQNKEDSDSETSHAENADTFLRSLSYASMGNVRC